MRWDRSYQSSDIEDRRSEGFSGGGGGLPSGLLNLFGMFGIRGLLIGMLLLAVVGGIGGGVRSCGTSTPSGAVQSTAEEDELVHFVGYVFDDVQNTWAKQLPGYRRAKLVLFRDGIASACGTASTAVGPFYCQLDNRVYIDLAFYEALRRRFGAPGDFAQAYVIAHEVGHHVQNLTDRIGRRGDRDSIHIELEADCLAGAWGKDADRRNLLDVGDLDEALHAAAAIGDDTLQKKTQGRVQPETWTHGSSAQRVASFKRGFDGGASACGL